MEGRCQTGRHLARRPNWFISCYSLGGSVISRALIRNIVQAAWLSASPSAATTTTRRSFLELFVSSPLVCSPVSPYEGDVVVSGVLPLGALPLLTSPVSKPATTPATPHPPLCLSPRRPLRFPHQPLPYLLPFWRGSFKRCGRRYLRILVDFGRFLYFYLLYSLADYSFSLADPFRGIRGRGGVLLRVC